MFDPSGGTAPDIAGKDVANPTAAIMAFASLVRHVGERDAAKAIRRAVKESIAAGEKTGDIGGSLSTSAFTEVVGERLSGLL